MIETKRSLTNQQEIYDVALTRANNVVTRHLQPSCHALRAFDQQTPLNMCSMWARIRCYGCSRPYLRNHDVYVFSCRKCGDLFQRNRHLTRDLTGLTALVIGARTKLGHQILLKLVQAGATVIGTSRYPEKALELFAAYPDYLEWKARLRFYDQPFDVDTPQIADTARSLVAWIQAQVDTKLDILIVSAAQTIRVREKTTMVSENKNRYDDARFVDRTQINSWQMTLTDLVQAEMEEVYRINAVAPVLVFQQCLPLLQQSRVHPYIIHVHAREGLFQVEKNAKHIHTNMAKAGLAMFTKCLKRARFKTQQGLSFYSHGCDPGWISVDEYYEKERPWIVPPLDEVDGAARVLYPIMKNIQGSFMRTRRHFEQLLY